MQFKAAIIAAIIGMTVSVQADTYCKIASGESYVNCRKSTNTHSDIVRKIYPADRFGVSCTREGEIVFGDATWDYIPGWGCWVSAYYTRSATTGVAHCEDQASTCPRSARFAALL